jgi:hypothetical protein
MKPANFPARRLARQARADERQRRHSTALAANGQMEAAKKAWPPRDIAPQEIAAARSIRRKKARGAPRANRLFEARP